MSMYFFNQCNYLYENVKVLSECAFGLTCILVFDLILFQKMNMVWEIHVQYAVRVKLLREVPKCALSGVKKITIPIPLAQQLMISPTTCFQRVKVFELLAKRKLLPDSTGLNEAILKTTEPFQLENIYV